MGNIIEVSKLEKSYGSVRAVRGIDFSVDRGTLFAFLDQMALESLPQSIWSVRCLPLTQEKSLLTAAYLARTTRPSGGQSALCSGSCLGSAPYRAGKIC